MKGLYLPSDDFSSNRVHPGACSEIRHSVHFGCLKIPHFTADIFTIWLLFPSPVGEMIFPVASRQPSWLSLFVRLFWMAWP